MIETLDVVKEKDAAITGRQSSNGAIDGQTVNGAGLCQITSAETASGAFFREVSHQLIE